MATALIALCAGNVKAANLWIIGDGTPYGWSLDAATALLSTTENESLYTGTIYLKADADFKLMTTTDWGGLEYGAAPDATLTDGKIALAKGQNDEGYGKIKVPENANYYITVNTETLEATIVKSEYQESQMGLCSLFLVGDATAGGWSIDNGTPLFQEKATPYVYSADIALSAGSFKIATVIKGAGTWDSKYFYFRDPENAGKIILNNSEDTQWSITEAATYTVTVNTIQETISIEKAGESNTVEIISDNDNFPTEYFTLAGVRVEKPSYGIYIVKKGNKVSKQVIR